MNTYKRYRFPPKIISYAVWLYHRFNLRRHLIRAEHYRNLREGEFGQWAEAVA
jgi:transposase-like protein